MSESPSRQERIRQRLQDALQPTELTLQDDSHRHAGHAAMKGITGSETHLKLHIVSEKFTGMSRVARHRLIEQLCSEERNDGLHALQIKALTPEESGR